MNNLHNGTLVENEFDPESEALSLISCPPASELSRGMLTRCDVQQNILTLKCVNDGKMRAAQSD